MIHSFDYPALAELALPAARAYAKIAPDAPHALHMPSHIFTRLGLWEESIASNLASAEAATRLLAEKQPEATAFDALHAIDYLAYAYLQQAQDDKALAMVDRVAKVKALDQSQFSAGYAMVAVPARYALERRRWSDAAALPDPPALFPWDKHSYAVAITHFARTVGAARGGKLDAARASLAELTKIAQALAAGPKVGFDWASQVEIQRLAAAGWVAHAEGKDDEARRLLAAAADLEDATDKHPVTPGSVLPAREQLGDLELELGDGRAALAAYEGSLRTAPRRLNSFYGAAQAAEKLGEKETAKRYLAEVAKLTGGRSGDRPELAKVLAASR
jgi:hypothetical protein